jgi:two-component system response regulator AdeR
MDDETQTVLVVDDEPTLVEIYRHWLGDEYETREATSGEEALEKLDDDVDLVVLDRVMPGITGDEVIDTIQERDLDCKIVMATAVETDADIVSTRSDANLIKPISGDELATTVSRTLDRPEYVDLETEYFDLISGRAMMKLNGEDYDEIGTQIDTLREKLDKRAKKMNDSEFISLMQKTIR